MAIHLERSAVAQHESATPGIRASWVLGACKSGIGEARVEGPAAIEVDLQDADLAVWDELPAGGDVDGTCRVGDEGNEEHCPQERRLHEHLLAAQYARRPTGVKPKTPRQKRHAPPEPGARDHLPGREVRGAPGLPQLGYTALALREMG